jgi:hypothetical protein
VKHLLWLALGVGIALAFLILSGGGADLSATAVADATRSDDSTVCAATSAESSLPPPDAADVARCWSEPWLDSDYPLKSLDSVEPAMEKLWDVVGLLRAGAEELTEVPLSEENIDGLEDLLQVPLEIAIEIRVEDGLPEELAKIAVGNDEALIGLARGCAAIWFLTCASDHPALMVLPSSHGTVSVDVAGEEPAPSANPPQAGSERRLYVCPPGTRVSMKASPDPGYEFARWVSYEFPPGESHESEHTPNIVEVSQPEAIEAVFSSVREPQGEP